MTAWVVWRQIPSSQRRAILQQVRRHGPKAAAAAVAYARSRRRR
jgi:hypothetical protein